MSTYYQCKLGRDGAETIAWIDERGAKIGADVVLLSADEKFWRVLEVYQPGLDEHALRQKQANDRNALPSIMAKS